MIHVDIMIMHKAKYEKINYHNIYNNAHVIHENNNVDVTKGLGKSVYS